MNNINDQQQVGNPYKKIIRIHVIAAVLIMSLVTGVYMIGKASCKTSVLGAQSPSPVSKFLAVIFKLNTEGPSQQMDTIQLAPTVEPTHMPIVEPTMPLFIQPTSSHILLPTPTTAGDPGMYWGGANRDSDTVTPYPTAPASTASPENTEPGNNRKNTPTPTSPQYRVDWDRTSSPTPTLMATPPDQNFNDPSDLKKRGPEATPTPTSIPKPLNPEQIKQIISTAGINLEKPEITTNVEKAGFTIHGAIKDTLFGFLPVTYPVTINVNEESGEIEEVSVPWWRELFGNPFRGNISKIRCGDGLCNPKEDFSTCPADCTPVCGNGICELGEGQDTCESDCTVMITPEPTISE